MTSTQFLDTYLSSAQVSLHSAIRLCADQEIEGFKDLQLIVGEIQQMRNRLRAQGKGDAGK